MSQPHPEEAAVTSQQQLDEMSEAEIVDRNRRVAALLRQFVAEVDEEDEKMWPLVKKEFNFFETLEVIQCSGTRSESAFPGSGC